MGIEMYGLALLCVVLRSCMLDLGDKSSSMAF